MTGHARPTGGPSLRELGMTDMSMRQLSRESEQKRLECQTGESLYKILMQDKHCVQDVGTSSADNACVALVCRGGALMGLHSSKHLACG